MTDNIERGVTPVTVDPDRVQHLKPQELLVDRNVRLTTKVDRQLVDSVKEHGVLQPITAVRTSEGLPRVRFGHRRTFAAIEADRATVPVLVVADEATDGAAEIDRILTQMTENEAREALSNPDRVSAVEQLALLGLTPAQIAARTSRDQAEISAALTVAKSEMAQAAAARYDFLTIDQAAAVAEFEDDAEGVKALVAAGKTGQFDHVLQTLRDARKEALAKEAAAAPLRAAGVTIIDAPTWRTPSTVVTLVDLVDIESGQPITPEEHATCPGHVAYIDDEWRDDEPDTDASRGEEDDQDSTEDDGGRYVWVPVYGCTDPQSNGHCKKWQRRAILAEGEAPKVSEQERAAAEEAAKEAARKERRDVIESNKAWRSAVTVRRDWLAKLPARKTAPKGTAGFLAVAQVADPSTLADVKGNHYAAQLLGCESTRYGHSTALVKVVEGAPATRVTLLHLIVALAAYEESLHDGTWRSVSPSVTRYLTFLESIGYALSPIELRAIGRKPEASTTSSEAKMPDTRARKQPTGQTAKAARAPRTRRTAEKATAAASTDAGADAGADVAW